MGTLTFEPIALLITGSQQGLARKAPPEPRPSQIFQLHTPAVGRDTSQ